jgi:hypothetical protein
MWYNYIKKIREGVFPSQVMEEQMTTAISELLGKIKELIDEYESTEEEDKKETILFLISKFQNGVNALVLSKLREESKNEVTRSKIIRD